MNLQLLNPFGHESFPERVSSSLDAQAQCVRFNGGSSRFAGSYIAVGRSDGGVGILDLETRNYLRYLEGHVRAVTNLCWSRNSRYLLSTSKDCVVIVWDLSTGDRLSTIRFDTPVVSAALHPRNCKILAVALHNSPQAIFVDLRNATGGQWALDVSAENVAAGDDDHVGKKRPRRENATVVRFNPRGDLLFVGSSQGTLYVYDTQIKTLVHTETISRASGVRGVEFDKSGLSLVVNSSDRIIRVYLVDEMAYYSRALLRHSTTGTSEAAYLTLLHKFQDLVNRTPWNAVRFSNDGEYIVGGAGHKAAHQIYLWDNGTGSLHKILEGPKDPLEELDWHPVKPMCASVSSDQGLLHIWSTSITERWSAYAPGFEELEENLEYQEREDEFDAEDESEAEMRKQNVQESFVDISDPDNSTSIPLPPGHATDSDLRVYLASSEAWADQEPDDDFDDNFFVPLDVDLREYELDAADISQIIEDDIRPSR